MLVMETTYSQTIPSQVIRHIMEGAVIQIIVLFLLLQIQFQAIRLVTRAEGFTLILEVLHPQITFYKGTLLDQWVVEFLLIGVPLI